MRTGADPCGFHEVYSNLLDKKLHGIDMNFFFCILIDIYVLTPLNNKEKLISV